MRDMANTDVNEAARDVELGNKQTPAAPPNVLEQARLGNLNLFRTALESGNHPLDFKAGRGQFFNRTPLHLAAMMGHEEIVEFLLSHPEISRERGRERGREVVNAKDCFGYTPLHLAVRHSHENVVRLLTTSSLVLPDRFITATSDPDDLGEHSGGFTPLHLAAVSGHIDIARLLLRQPCQVEFAYDPVNLHAMTWDGKTPLDVAQERFYPSLSDKSFFLGSKSLFSYDRAKRQNYLELVKLLALSDSNWLQQYRERTAMSANAILVGSALVVAASFGSWLQPPGGIPVSDFGTPSSRPSKYGSADRYWLCGFYVCVTLSFCFSMVALMIGTLVTLPGLELSSKFEVMRLRQAVAIAQYCLFWAVLCLLVCFSFAASIVLRKFAAVYRTHSYYVVIWLPVITFVFVAFLIGLWGLDRHSEYGMKRRVISVCAAVVYGLTFIISRSHKK